MSSFCSYVESCDSVPHIQYITGELPLRKDSMMSIARKAAAVLGFSEALLCSEGKVIEVCGRILGWRDLMCRESRDERRR